MSSLSMNLYSALVTIGNTKEVGHGPFLKLLIELHAIRKTRKYDR